MVLEVQLLPRQDPQYKNCRKKKNTDAKKQIELKSPKYVFDTHELMSTNSYNQALNLCH
jgi:hypothetical protein